MGSRAGVRRSAVLRLAAVTALVLLATVGAGAAAAAPNPWQFLYGCPVDNAAMLAVPAGSPSSCVDLAGHDSNYNVGSKHTPADYIDLTFGLPTGLGQPGTAVRGSFYDAVGPFPVGPSLKLPFFDFCSIYPFFSLSWRECEAGLDPISNLNSAEGTVDGLAYNLTGMAAKLELAGAPSDFDPAAIQSPGAQALTLPVKLALTAPGVGKTCSVGTDTAPIVLHLKAITPATQTATAADPNGYPVAFTTYSLNELGDTSFREPGASGCGPSGLLDGVVDALLGLPRAAGKNSFTMQDLVTSVASTTAGGSVLSQAYHAGLN